MTSIAYEQHDMLSKTVYHGMNVHHAYLLL